MSKRKKDRVKELAVEIDIIDHMIAALVDVLEKKGILTSEEWVSFSSKNPGKSSRSRSIEMSAMARLDGRFLPSRWLMPPEVA